jgi:hypothetical protein
MLMKCASLPQSEGISNESTPLRSEKSEYAMRLKFNADHLIGVGNAPSEQTPESLSEDFAPPTWGTWSATDVQSLDMQAVPPEIDWVSSRSASGRLILIIRLDTFRFYHAESKPHATILNVDV